MLEKAKRSLADLLGQRKCFEERKADIEKRFADAGATPDADMEAIENDLSALEKEVEEAARVAQAEDFIKKLPGGYSAHIAQGGTNVSGGQKQRLSIARAICKNPDIFIFDDSFSALDMKTDMKLRQALKPITADMVVMVVAQRVSTIKNADQIVVLDNGRMAGKGKHNELLKSCEIYREIVKSQLSDKEFEKEMRLANA